MTETHYDYSFKTGIQKVLDQVHPDMQLDSKSKELLNLLMHYTADRILDASNLLKGKHPTVKADEIQSAVRLIFPGELMNHSISLGTKAVTAFNARDRSGRGPHKRVSREKDAMIVFKPSTAENLIRKLSTGKTRVGKDATVFLAAVLEYIAAEVLELAGNSARDNKHVRINTRDVFLAVQKDPELRKLYNDVILTGNMPNIAPQYLPKKKSSKSTSSQYYY